MQSGLYRLVKDSPCPQGIKTRSFHPAAATHTRLCLWKTAHFTNNPIQDIHARLAIRAPARAGLSTPSTNRWEKQIESTPEGSIRPIF
jgi:hypothetical protein